MVAFFEGTASGCAALHPIDDETVEVKRMYFDPAMRGNGIARALAKHVIERAREMGTPAA